MQSITGIYMSTIYRSYDGNVRFRFKYFGAAREFHVILCEGIIPYYVKDMPLEITGEYNENNIFIISSIKEKIDDVQISIKYLSNKIVGMGPKKAKALVDKYGPDIFSFIQEIDVIDKLKTIKGINENLAQEIVYNIRNTIEQRLIFEFIAKYNGSLNSVDKIFSKYGINSLKIFQNNIYSIGVESGMSFYQCDGIALKFDYDYLDFRRIDGMLLEAMNIITSAGHVYATISEIKKVINYITKNSACPHRKVPIPYIMAELHNCKFLYIDKKDNKITRIYLKNMWVQENDIVKNIKRINNIHKNNIYEENIIDKLEDEYKIKYSKMQKEAFNVLKTTGIKIITGGPGTGKTTTINGIISAYEKLNVGKKIVLCAPTGRAAQRMKEASNRTSTTIHKLLGLKPFDNVFTAKSDLTEIPADFIIVDEFSMVDMETMFLFLNAIKSDALVLFVGDINQLPSVGAGNIMRDIIASKIIETHELDMIFRQKEDSSIIYNSQQIINNNIDLLQDKNFKIITLKNNETFEDRIKYIIPKLGKAWLSETQFLSNVKRNDGGTIALNKVIQEMMGDLEANKTKFFGTTFYENDKIIVTTNDYEIGIYNGDIGTIFKIFPTGMEILINDDIVFVPIDKYEEIALAYAITIHKSQGSEFNNVIITLPEEPINMLERNILYTAITRAKNNVILITKNNSLKTAIERNNNIKRNTGLKEKLLENN